MSSDNQAPVVKETEAAITESSGDNEENKDEKVKIIHCIYFPKFYFPCIERRGRGKWRR